MIGRSCVTQFLDTYHRLAYGVDKGNQSDIVFLDFSKAFDFVFPVHIIYKLRKFGISVSLLQWFVSYLDGRLRRVAIDGETSEWRSVTSGVPQGSILGPLLFILFINNVPDAISNSSTLAIFADDAKCLYTIYSDRDCLAFQADIQPE